MDAAVLKLALLLGLVLVNGADEPNSANIDDVNLPTLRREKRSELDNYVDCPSAWNVVSNPGETTYNCPPGSHPQSTQHIALSQPCPPWVDAAGDCHVTDDRVEKAECVQQWPELYAEWQLNAIKPPPYHPQKLPALTCISDQS